MTPLPTLAPPAASPEPAAGLAAHNPLLARLALRRHLLCPDGSALLADGGAPASPVALAGALGVGLLGGAAFAVVLGLATDGGTLAAEAPATLGALLLSGLLTFPPLVLLQALRQRAGSVLHLAAAAAVGPAVCGAWLGATAPVLLLYALTGEIGLGFALLAALLGAMALLAGAVAAGKRALRTGGATPGLLAVLAHYALTAWTAAVLVAHLS